MIERYEKRGSAIRLDLVRGESFTTVVNESGVAVTTDASFHAHSLDVESTPDLSLPPALGKACATLANQPIERASLVAGRSHHTVNAAGDDREWSSSEEVAVLTLATAFRPLMVTLPLDQATRWLESYAPELQHRAAGIRETALVTLLPFAAAQFWSYAAPSRQSLRNTVLQQRPRSDGERDGSGHRIDTSPTAIVSRNNAFRPSYRYPAVRRPMHVAALPFGVPPDNELRIIAFESLRPSGHQTTGGAFITNGRGTLLAEVVIDENSVRHVGETQEWFPIDGGAWGGETTLQLSIREVQLS